MGRSPVSSASEYLVIRVADADAFESEFIKEGKGLDGNNEADTLDGDENLTGQSTLFKSMLFHCDFLCQLELLARPSRNASMRPTGLWVVSVMPIMMIAGE